MFKELFITKYCCLCQKLGTMLCQTCSSQLPHLVEDSAICLEYNDKVAQMISLFKSQHQLYFANVFAELLLKKIQIKPDIIIPVPLHRLRLKERGFNQTLEIAKPISKQLNIPIDFHSLIKIKHTAPQASLKEIARRANLKKSFKVTKDLRQKKIALLDDVITTGTTTQTIKELLLKHGAESVEIWAVAKTKLKYKK